MARVPIDRWDDLIGVIAVMGLRPPANRVTISGYIDTQASQPPASGGGAIERRSDNGQLSRFRLPLSVRALAHADPTMSAHAGQAGRRKFRHPPRPLVTSDQA